MFILAVDVNNFARASPFYLSQIFELIEKDETTWNTMKDGSFCVAKSEVSFTAIGPNGMQEENSIKSAGWN